MYLRSVVVWSGKFSVEEPKNLAGQPTKTTMKDGLWQALEGRTHPGAPDPGPTDGAVSEPADQRRSALLHCRRLH